jgi:2-(1,2-epoxy-1,2-dihydrophenyl)acetyl-CoA isomerase
MDAGQGCDGPPFPDIIERGARPACPGETRRKTPMSEADAVLGKTVLHRIENGISYITMNRPEAGNAIHYTQRTVIRALLQAAADDCEIRGIVLAANGKHFCTGADLRSPPGADRVKRPGDISRLTQHGPEAAQRFINAILDCSKPIIGVVQGAAAGMGAQIALACDILVASEAAYFTQIFVRRGILVDAGGAYLLTRRIGLQKAKELVFFGDNLTAREAFELGMVNKVVPPEQLTEAAESYARRLAVAPTTAIGLAKQLLNRALDSDRETAFREEALSTEINAQTLDQKEGVTAFLEKRPPKFVGY